MSNSGCSDNDADDNGGAIQMGNNVILVEAVSKRQVSIILIINYQIHSI
jgi:hypothetical protein